MTAFTQTALSRDLPRRASRATSASSATASTSSGLRRCRPGSSRVRRPASLTWANRTTARPALPTASSASTSRGRWPRSTAAWTPAPRCTTTCRASRHTTTRSSCARRSSRGCSKRTRRASWWSTAPASQSGCSRTRPSTCRCGSSIPSRIGRSWERFKERLDPTTPQRYPADWDAYAARINALDCPVSMEVGGFFGYLNMWVGTQDLMYLFYDDPGLVEDMMETILHLELEMVRRVTQGHPTRLGLVLGGHGLQERVHDLARHGAALHDAALSCAQRGHPQRRL